jgi:hypothetical protein
VNIFTKDLPSHEESVKITVLYIRKYMRPGVEFPANKVSGDGEEIKQSNLHFAIEMLKQKFRIYNFNFKRILLNVSHLIGNVFSGGL